MSSKRGIRRRSCEGKVRYETADEAWRMAHHGTTVYQCGFCKAYHLGHRGSRKPRASDTGYPKCP